MKAENRLKKILLNGNYQLRIVRELNASSFDSTWLLQLEDSGKPTCGAKGPTFNSALKNLGKVWAEL